MTDVARLHRPRGCSTSNAPGGPATADTRRDDLVAFRKGLEVDHHDNVSPVLSGLLLLAVGREHQDWSDALCTTLGLLVVVLFLRRGVRDHLAHAEGREAAARLSRTEPR